MAGFKTFLETLGADAKKVFSWVGTPKAQATITAVEGAGEAVGAAILLDKRNATMVAGVVS